MKFKIKGYSVLIDNQDFYVIKKYKWSVVLKNKVPYVFATTKNKTIYLARVLLDASKNIIVDHINGNTLDNRKQNLRFATKQTNAHNMRSHSDSSSKYKGVCWDKSRSKWRANIKINGKQTHLGRYNTELEAAKAYNNAASDYFGEFARLNSLD